jgi:hypothetical protein
MKNWVIPSLLVVAILAGVGAGYLLGNSNEHTVTATAISQYPITFLGPPKGCSIEGFCINATLVNHLGSNITAIAFAWLRNVTTGQNVTMLGGGKNSLAVATCIVDYRRPSDCYVIAYPIGGTTYEVTLTIFGLDGKTVLSPAVTTNVTH